MLQFVFESKFDLRLEKGLKNNLFFKLGIKFGMINFYEQIICKTTLTRKKYDAL